MIMNNFLDKCCSIRDWPCFFIMGFPSQMLGIVEISNIFHFMWIEIIGMEFTEKHFSPLNIVSFEYTISYTYLFAWRSLLSTFYLVIW